MNKSTQKVSKFILNLTKSLQGITGTKYTKNKNTDVRPTPTKTQEWLLKLKHF